MRTSSKSGPACIAAVILVSSSPNHHPLSARKPPAGLGVHVLHDEPGWQASVLRLLDVSSTVFADHPIPNTAKVQVDPIPARASCLKTKRATRIW